jgi:hypothetical protein
MKLNMGCGHNKMDGWVNVDLSAECAPDVVCDLESLPWPWTDDSVEEVLFNHSLEHLGQNPRVFLGMMQELYRVCRDGARIEIHVPHPRHDDFIGDPTHVRPITPALLTLFDRRQCDEWQRLGAANSPFAHYLHVDFALVDTQWILDEPYSTQYREKVISHADFERMARQLNNVIKEIWMVAIARKSR